MLFCAFTSPEKVSVGNSEEPVMSLPYRAKDLLAEFADSETGDGFVINPWTDDFKLSREDVKKVFGKGQRVTICCDLTLPGETIITASVEEVLKRVGGKKAEFMLVIM